MYGIFLVIYGCKNGLDVSLYISFNKFILLVADDGEIIVREKTTTAKIHKCKFEECGKIFHDYTALKKHMLTHGER